MEIEVITAIKINLTKEEYEILNKACNILSNFEMNASDNEINALQANYIKSVDYIEQNYALPTTVDFITMLLTEYEKNK